VSVVDTTSERGDGTINRPSLEADEPLQSDLADLREFAQELTLLRKRPSHEPHGRERSTLEPAEGGQAAYTSGRINVDPAAVEQSLAKLVLTLIEFIRQLLERQAIRRMEGGSLTDDEIERMGETFLRLERRMEELKAAFGLQDEELNLSLGPLGNLLPEE
jgi:hypothetical protein